MPCTRGKHILIDELRSIQREHGWLPATALHALSERSNIPLYQLHGVASFYPHFRLTPPPVVDVRVCRDMSCHLRGADALADGLRGRLADAGAAGVAVGDASCLGRCDRAPAASVNDTILGGLTADALAQVVLGAAASRPVPREERMAPAPSLGSDPYEAGDRYGAFRALRETRDVAGTIAALKQSGLRGLGGAGFGTGLKWEIVRAAAGEPKYVVCNADESEPGTIKDRFIMEHLPHLVVEGMMIAGLVTGAREGIVYIRHEYEAQTERLEHEIERCRQAGLLGADAVGPGRPFEMRVFVSPGGYICGEESALLEALEGKRAEPRNKPPFPGTHGLWQKPTAINNVETFACVPLILVRGPEAFKRLGKGGAPGLKFVGVSGHVRRPGVYEVPMGTSAREVIFDRAGGPLEGRRLKGWAPSGPSSGYLPASKLDVALDFNALAAEGSMLGSGAIVVCDDTACMLDMALNAIRFFRNESCGKCVPCRVGTVKMVAMLQGIARGAGADLALLDELAVAMRTASICGLGQIAPAPIASVLTHFRDEVDEHLLRRRCPAGVCPTA
ncbi:MAG: NADH-ubiquinone oxidoreductase-F iron-sulfur binding region domain-containing protein [Candidatus Rokuibacteriota bacterium]